MQMMTETVIRLREFVRMNPRMPLLNSKGEGDDDDLSTHARPLFGSLGGSGSDTYQPICFRDEQSDSKQDVSYVRAS